MFRFAKLATKSKLQFTPQLQFSRSFTTLFPKQQQQQCTFYNNNPFRYTFPKFKSDRQSIPSSTQKRTMSQTNKQQIVLEQRPGPKMKQNQSTIGASPDNQRNANKITPIVQPFQKELPLYMRTLYATNRFFNSKLGFLTIALFVGAVSYQAFNAAVGPLTNMKRERDWNNFLSTREKALQEAGLSIDVPKQGDFAPFEFQCTKPLPNQLDPQEYQRLQKEAINFIFQCEQLALNQYLLLKQSLTPEELYESRFLLRALEQLFMHVAIVGNQNSQNNTRQLISEVLPDIPAHSDPIEERLIPAITASQSLLAMFRDAPIYLKNRRLIRQSINNPIFNELFIKGREENGIPPVINPHMDSKEDPNILPFGTEAANITLSRLYVNGALENLELESIAYDQTQDGTPFVLRQQAGCIKPVEIEPTSVVNFAALQMLDENTRSPRPPLLFNSNGDGQAFCFTPVPVALSFLPLIPSIDIADIEHAEDENGRINELRLFLEIYADTVHLRPSHESPTVLYTFGLKPEKIMEKYVSRVLRIPDMRDDVEDDNIVKRFFAQFFDEYRFLEARARHEQKHLDRPEYSQTFRKYTKEQLIWFDPNESPEEEELSEVELQQQLALDLARLRQAVKTGDATDEEIEAYNFAVENGLYETVLNSQNHLDINLFQQKLDKIAELETKQREMKGLREVLDLAQV